MLEYVYYRVGKGGYEAYTSQMWDLSEADFSRTADMYVGNLGSLRLLCEGNGIGFLPVTFIGVYEGMPIGRGRRATLLRSEAQKPLGGSRIPSLRLVAGVFWREGQGCTLL